MDNYFPKITIITPSLNQGTYIERTILSIINQNYPNLEFIIIDGGSVDETIEIIEKYQTWIYYWISEKDNGQAEAINKGLKIASGEIINWINSDDILEKGALSDIAQKYHSSISFYLGNTHIIDTNDQIIGNISQTNYAGLNIFDCLEMGLNQPASFFNRSVIERIGLLNENLNYSFDLDLWKRFLLNFRNPEVIKLESYLARFRVHELSKTSIENLLPDNNFSIENKAALKSYFLILKNRKVSVIQKILELDVEYDLFTPILDLKLTNALANEIIYRYILKRKKNLGFISALKYYLYLDISYLSSKIIKRLKFELSK